MYHHPLSQKAFYAQSPRYAAHLRHLMLAGLLRHGGVLLAVAQSPRHTYGRPSTQVVALLTTIWPPRDPNCLNHKTIALRIQFPFTAPIARAPLRLPIALPLLPRIGRGSASGCGVLIVVQVSTRSPAEYLVLHTPSHEFVQIDILPDGGHCMAAACDGCTLSDT